jgi:quercetin dioxygenase-like cupin family protein
MTSVWWSSRLISAAAATSGRLFGASTGRVVRAKVIAMEKSSLTALAREQLKLASQASSGRSADTVYGGHEHVLRQTVIALMAGRTLEEHENPGEATVHVLLGRIRLRGNGNEWEGSPGDLLIVPPHRHAVEALEDSAMLLTVAKLGGN